MNILGINAYHGDASAALIQDGKLVAAVEEERFLRVKHWAGFPAESIRYCLREGGIELRDLDHVTLSFNPRANIGQKLKFSLFNRPEIGSILDRLKRQSKSSTLKENLAETFGVSPDEFKAEVHNVEHHSSHFASTFFLSPYEEAAILSIDGMGDFVSTMSGFGAGNKYKVDSRIHYPHSLGFLYNAMTLYLGFPNYGDEYKVMGLAAYGEPEYAEKIRKIVYPKGDGFELNLDYFTHQKQGIAMSWDKGAPIVESFHSPELEKLLGPARASKDEITRHHENIASSLQLVTEEIIFHLCRKLYDKHPVENLCLSGGCAMNSVANGKLYAETPFTNIYVPAGAADNGTCFGSAFDLWHQTLDKPRGFQLITSCWGPEYPESDCKEAVENEDVHYTRLDTEPLLERVVDLMCEGKVVGWYQGRMEFGARALGNRSLIADPRREDMRDIINLKIKFREKFRPFAPSILRERVGEYFELDTDVPFMEKVLKIRPEMHSKIPAVTHVDGTGRLQSVTSEQNPLYYKLIKTFEKRTGVPLVLNTSLNENEPIVCTPKEALSCFLRTHMDAIAIGPYLVERNPSSN